MYLMLFITYSIIYLFIIIIFLYFSTNSIIFNRLLYLLYRAMKVNLIKMYHYLNER